MNSRSAMLTARHEKMSTDYSDVSFLRTTGRQIEQSHLSTVLPGTDTTSVLKQHPSQTNNPNTTINPPVDDPSNDGDRGDILFRGLWKNQHETIFESQTRTRTQMPTSIKISMTYSEDKKRRRGRNNSALVWNNVDHSCHS
jgi:hypothetical protein